MKLPIVFAITLCYFNLSNITTQLIMRNIEVNIIQQKKTNKEQLIGQWYFLSKDNDNNSKVDNLAEGKSITFKSNLKYSSDIFTKNETGTWDFDEKTQELTCTSKINTTKWNLKRLNEFGMVMINQKTKEKWIFAIAD